MNQTTLLQYINNPSLLASAQTTELEQLVSDFPYCQINHLLYTKALFEQKNILYHSQLKKTAANIPDRSILYFLINGGTEFLLKSQSFIKPVFNKKEKNEDSPPVLINKINTPVSETSLNSLIDHLNKLSFVTLPDFGDIETKLKLIQAEHDQRVETIVNEYLSLRQEQKEEFNTEICSAIIEESNEQAYTETSEIEKPKSETVEEVKIQEKNPSKTDLIEKFIREEPGLSKTKKEFYNPVNMAQISTIDNEDLVSETLAEVYLKQGSIQKAIKIYNRLCLIIPEKSTYFAARIEIIKKENNLL
jgi:hypothetical protein